MTKAKSGAKESSVDVHIRSLITRDLPLQAWLHDAKNPLNNPLYSSLIVINRMALALHAEKTEKYGN